MFHLQQDVFVSLGFAALALIVVLPVRGQLLRSLRGLLSIFNGLGPLRKFAVLALIAHLTMFAGGKHGGTNDVDGADLQNGEAASSPLVMNGRFRFLTSGEDAASPLTVTPDDIARGWQLWEVRTNGDLCYTMPEGAMMASNWWVRGAYEDVKEIGLEGLEGLGGLEWRFPFGTNEYDSAWAFTWGKVRFELGNTNTEIVAVGAPMSAVPYCSRLWSAADTNGAKVVTWENFALGRVSSADYQLPSTNYQLVSAQIELRRNGDFITRSNEVETVCRRLDPEDWDGDGWENGDDPDPYSWEEFWDDFYQELPDGANEAAYCWIEVRPKWNSDIWFYGDAPSDLDDPYIYGKAGKTYRVQLLIGKTYYVESSQPVDVVAKSDERIAVSNVAPNSFTVVWPVTFTVAEGRAPEPRPRLGATWNDGGKSFYVMPNPPWLRGTVTWTDNYCCGVWGDGTNFTYACDNECTCEGCAVFGNYWYEGYALPVWGLECGCHYIEDHGPTEMSLTFDKSAAIYEDDYTNMPGVVVHPTPSNVVLRCEVYGGTYGGRLTVTLNGAGHRKIARVSGDALPNNVLIQPDATRVFETVYTPLEPSDRANDIVAVATFVEDFTHDEYEPQVATLTSVKVELEVNRVALLNSCRQRHVYGVAEDVRLKSCPALATASWNVSINGKEVLDSPLYPAGEGFICSWTAGVGRVEYTLDGVSYSTSIRVIEPEIEIRNARANDRFSEEAKMWDPTLVDVNPVVGEAGHLLLFLDRYAAPYYVSFEGLQFVEIPDESHNCPHDRQGYYADETRGGPLSHTQLAGAGRWRQTNSQAFFGTDAAGTHAAYSQPWMDGWKSWPIPMGWGFGVDVLGRFKDYPTFQTYTLSSDGTFQIEKFNHWAERNTLGMVWVDGSLQVSPWPW